MTSALCFRCQIHRHIGETRVIKGTQNMYDEHMVMFTNDKYRNSTLLFAAFLVIHFLVLTLNGYSYRISTTATAHKHCLVKVFGISQATYSTAPIWAHHCHLPSYPCVLQVTVAGHQSATHQQ